MTTTAVGSGSWGVGPATSLQLPTFYHPARAPLTTFTPLPSRKICSISKLRDDHWRRPELRAERESVGAWAEFSFIADALRLLAECLTWSKRSWPFLRYDTRNGYLSGAECAEEAANLDRLAPYPKIEAYSSSHKPGHGLRKFIGASQHGDFAARAQMIIDYLKNTGDGCFSPAIADERRFKACRESADPVALTIATRIPVRGSDRASLTGARRNLPRCGFQDRCRHGLSGGSRVSGKRAEIWRVHSYFRWPHPRTRRMCAGEGEAG
jgi:hypothetical protein